MTPTLLPLYLGVVGLVVGSFLGLVSVRLPEGEGVVSGRSRCRSCDRRLSWSDLVPVVSYARTQGRCRTCGAAIPVKYPIMELTSGGIGVGAALLGSHLPGVIVIAGFGWLLLLIAVIYLERA